MIEEKNSIVTSATGGEQQKGEFEIIYQTNNRKNYEIVQELCRYFIDKRNLEKENAQLKEIEKEHQRINGELREENKQLKEIIDEARQFILDGRYGEEDDYESISLYIPDLLQILDKGESNE